LTSLETFLLGLGVIKLDPWLSPFKDALRSRYSAAQKWIKTLNETEGGLDKFSRGYEKYGLNMLENGDIVYREWAPNATHAYLMGDFSKSCPPLLVYAKH
jgi:1,4-alpha-glucan branching enzyme